jgi:DNA-binding HxlR family transcriptional regulator
LGFEHSWSGAVWRVAEAGGRNFLAVLAERLRMLEKNEFVFRHYAQTIPPAVTYGITKRMKDIEKVLQDLERLARKWKVEELASTGS